MNRQSFRGPERAPWLAPSGRDRKLRSHCNASAHGRSREAPVVGAKSHVR